MDEETERVRIGLAYVCANGDELKAGLPPELAAKIDRLLAAAGQSGDGLAPLMDEIHDAVRASGDTYGVYGSTVRSPVLPGVSPTPREIAYVCPDHRCDRVDWEEDRIGTPLCAVSGQALRRELLD